MINMQKGRKQKTAKEKENKRQAGAAGRVVSETRVTRAPFVGREGAAVWSFMSGQAQGVGHWGERGNAIT